mmetsp:Transcript_30351/g.61110  ORF Transcript_30351/g.61110 Transcript_30351/m.61110 type:complete len:204 (-) Transcript_30351:258-869(-)
MPRPGPLRCQLRLPHQVCKSAGRTVPSTHAARRASPIRDFPPAGRFKTAPQPLRPRPNSGVGAAETRHHVDLHGDARRNRGGAQGATREAGRAVRALESALRQKLDVRSKRVGGGYRAFCRSVWSGDGQAVRAGVGQDGHDGVPPAAFARGRRAAARHALHGEAHRPARAGQVSARVSGVCRGPALARNGGSIPGPAGVLPEC